MAVFKIVKQYQTKGYQDIVTRVLLFTCWFVVLYAYVS